MSGPPGPPLFGHHMPGHVWTWEQHSSRIQGIALHTSLPIHHQNSLVRPNSHSPWRKMPVVQESNQSTSASNVIPSGANNLPCAEVPRQISNQASSEQSDGSTPVKKKRKRLRNKKKWFDQFASNVASRMKAMESTNTSSNQSSTARLAEKNDDPCVSSRTDNASTATTLTMQQNVKAITGPPQQNIDVANPGPSKTIDFGLYLNTKDFSDITLVADAEREFYAHKIILASRSTFFAEIFKQNQEPMTKIEIMDVKGDILDQVLNFIYSGKVSMSDDNVSDMCAAAEKFTLHDLKAQCSQYLIQNLSSDNAVKVLIVASTNNMPELRKKCFTFINKHAHSVIETEDYKNLAAAFPFLLDELYRHLVNSVLPRPPSQT